MIAAAWPIGPIVGQVFRGFAYDGRQWRQSRGAEWSNVQVFRASGRYVPSEDLIYAIVECIGAGGGGGWATSPVDGVTLSPTAAGGGGSGGYSRKTLPAELVIQGADVVVPLGGIVSAGQAGGGVTAGDTSFGALCVAHAGGNAQAYDGSGTVAAHGVPGAGAALGIGDFCEPGAAGSMWAAINVNLNTQHLVGVTPGIGGQLFGGAAWPPLSGTSWIYTNANGANGAANSGAGGGGAQVNTGSVVTTTFGGTGGSGICIVTEICGTEGNGGGGPGPEPPGTGRPPGVPLNLNVKAAVTHVPFDPDAPHVDPRGTR